MILVKVLQKGTINRRQKEGGKGDFSVLFLWKGMGRAVSQNALGCAAGCLSSPGLWLFGRCEDGTNSMPGPVFSTKEEFLNLTEK